MENDGRLDERMWRRRLELEWFGFRLAVIRAALEMKDSTDQPRAPAGTSEGGRLIAASGANSGGASTLDDGVFRSGATDDPFLQDVAQRARPTGPVDLRAEEASGGHAIGRHVAKTDTQLRTAILAEDPPMPLSLFARSGDPQGSSIHRLGQSIRQRNFRTKPRTSSKGCQR